MTKMSLEEFLKSAIRFMVIKEPVVRAVRGAPKKIDQGALDEALALTNLVNSFVRGDTSDDSTKKDLINYLKRLNELCLTAPKGSILEQEIFRQVRRSIIDLVDECSSFDEFIQIVLNNDLRIILAFNEVQISLESLVRLAQKTKRKVLAAKKTCKK